MNAHLLLVVVGTLVTLTGFVIHIHARRRFRAPAAPDIRPMIRPSQWRTRREWFSSEYGYRLSRRGAMLISLGGLIALIGGLL